MGQQRRQITKQYWSEGYIHKRMGKQADTFTEFRDRVDGFIAEMPNLEDNTVIFGHGIWFGMLCWRLLGFAAHDQHGMLAFRRFQSGLPLLNCLTYVLQSQGEDRWSFQVHQGLLNRLTNQDIY